MEKITLTFDKLKKSKNTNDVDRILDELDINEKYRVKEDVYPSLNFKITKEEIEELKRLNKLTDDNLIADIKNADAMTRLLYAIAWKNGDIKKIKHVIEGIIAPDKDREKGIVFFQFGKHLTKDSGEPIIDQHVLRAFGIFISGNDEKAIENYRNFSIITPEHKSLIDQYRKWLKNELTHELQNSSEHLYHVDKVLFAVGKMAKAK